MDLGGIQFQEVQTTFLVMVLVISSVAVRLIRFVVVPKVL